MPLVYLDQNALIELGVRARKPEFREKLDSVIGSGALTAVVSSWHLIETANTTNLANAVELAEFMDSLKPFWLLERQNIQKLDVQEEQSKREAGSAQKTGIRFLLRAEGTRLHV